MALDKLHVHSCCKHFGQGCERVEEPVAKDKSLLRSTCNASAVVAKSPCDSRDSTSLVKQQCQEHS